MAEPTTTKKKTSTRKTAAQKKVEEALQNGEQPTEEQPAESIVAIDLFELASGLLELTPEEKALIEITAGLPRLTVSVGAKVETLPYQNVNFSYTATVPVGLTPGSKAWQMFWDMYDRTANGSTSHINNQHITPRVDAIRKQFAKQGVAQ